MNLLSDAAISGRPKPFRLLPPVGKCITVKDTMLDRIHIDPAVCGGKPTVRGLRVTVDFVLKLLGDGYTAQDIVREYPELELEDIYQAAKYGAWLASERTSAVS